MQGKVTHFFLANGLSELKNSTYDDVSPFQSFDGQVNNTEFPETTDVMLEFSNASGIRKRRQETRQDRKATIGRRARKTNRQLARQDRKATIGRKARKTSRQEARQDRMASRQQARQEARLRRLDNKGAETESNLKIAKEIATTTPEEAQLINELSKDVQNPSEIKKSGLSKNAKIGIGIGAVVVVGLIAFVVIRKMKSKNK